ncbi:MAG: Smr/MutS family protein [Desulfobacula sp.]|nr:Smr/MutS family protein [Desulfobacula sp.]
MGKRSKNKKKNKLPIFHSDADFLKEFEKENHLKNRTENKVQQDSTSINKHGVPVLDSQSSYRDCNEQETEMDFAQLLKESYKQKSSKKVKKSFKPMSLKKRLKRYPPVELELDLHGFTSIGAQIKAKSFINSCKQQGFFTIRIIVGKGLHSQMGAVLPDVVEDVVKELKQHDQVLSFEWEKKKKINSGSMIVYIKQFDQFD